MRKNQNIWKSIISFLLCFITIIGLSLPAFANEGTADQSPNLAGLTNREATTKTGTEIRGIDVSRWQGSIKWNLVATDNVDFAFIRATYGTKKDAYFYSNATAAHKEGIKVGAYHYACFTDTASMKKEAEIFLAQLKRVNITYPVVLDVEEKKGLSRKQLSNLAKQFMDIIAKEGYEVMIYSYQNFFRDHLNKSAFVGYDFWVANYVRKPNIPYSIWQHTSKGKVKGITGNVDINVVSKPITPVSTGGVTKKVVLNKGLSDGIKTYLNTTYSAGIDLTAPLDAKLIKKRISIGLQTELNKMYEKQLPVTGKLTFHELQRLSELDYNNNFPSTINLLQSQLFYMGFYEQTPNGIYDDMTKNAIREFQSYYRITQTGKFDHDTIRKLFDIETL